MFCNRKSVCTQGIGGVDQKIGVFEIAEHQEIDGDPEDQQQANPTVPAGQALGGDPSGDDEIEYRDAAEQRQIGRVPPAIEEERGCEQQPQHGARAGELAQHDVEAHSRRQKREQEDRRIEQHNVNVSPADWRASILSRKICAERSLLRDVRDASKAWLTAASSAGSSRERFAMSRMYRYRLPVEQTKWKFDSKAETCFTWECDDSRAALLQLYDKGKER